MKKYHLTFIRDGSFVSAFTELTSLEAFMAIEMELGRVVHILYSRELSMDEWASAKELGLC